MQINGISSSNLKLIGHSFKQILLNSYLYSLLSLQE